MPEVISTRASADATAYFPSAFNDSVRIGAFRRVLRAHPTMAWARARSLHDDLEQIALLEVAKVLRQFDPSVGTSVEQFVGVAMRQRMFSCRRALLGAYGVSPESDEVTDAHDEFGQADNIPDANPSANVEEVCAQRQRTQSLGNAVAALPTRQRAIVQLMLEDHTEREIAEQLGVSIQAVNKSKLSAIKTLQQVLVSPMQ